MNLILLQITSLVYIILLNIFYFSKEHITNKENKIYKYLLISNVFGLLIELGCFYTVLHMEEIPIINIVVTKALLVYYFLFIFIYTYYVFIVAFNDKNDTTKNNSFFDKVKIWCTILFIICSIIDIFLPMEYFNDGKYVYSYGKSVDFLALMLVIIMGVWLVVILKKIRNIKVKKYLPILMFIALAGVGGFIQKTYPYVLLTTPIETLIIFLMYFTIENPDVKMLDEVYRAKEISDNSNEEKTMFLYNMTNEIRNVTRDIDNSADEILDEVDNKEIDADFISDSAREIKGSTAKFTTMTNEILDISSVDSANVKIYNDKYNIKLLFKELVTMYKSKAKKKGISFRTEIASDIPEYLYGDSVGVKSVLTTLLDNALKFTDKGYVEFRVNIIIKKDICRLIIVTEDSGIGMRAKDMELYFNKHKEELEKSNLKNNLYTARKVITLMGGTLIPSSTYGSGTIMKVVLDQRIADLDNKLDNYDNLYDKKKILLVDDNESSIKIIEKNLKDTNIEMDSTLLGKECLDKIRNKEKYDLILIDEDMSPLDGKEIMRKLKDIRLFNTKVILLSKNREYEYSDEYLKYGFSDVILKPIDKNELLEKLFKYLK